ncbi:amidase [Pseudomonas sichuanensis]|uniref:amidase n=1 Tax=Pseudomonas sichuanensis TaxID=2213015 RepID=UPI000DA6ABC0|nr:amidase family protein [Pseudomonas sichuanensis]
MPDPTLLPVAELVSLLRSGALSPVELIDQSFARIDAIDPHLRLFTWQDRERARASALDAERRYRAGGELPALLGVPFTVKEQIPVAGAPQTFGSALYRDHVASADDPSVQRLRNAGGILLGTTTMPEFGAKASTDSRLFGITRNPWDPSRTTGGSSGGAAAAVAVGAGAIAVGTDIAGSVRIPASCCGVLGIKPTLGAIPQVHALDLFNALGHQGTLTRSVADAALALEVLIGPDPRDPWSLRAPRRALRDAARADGDLRGLRVAWLPEVGKGPADAQVLQAGERVANALGEAGATVQQHRLDLSDSGAAFEPTVLALKRRFLGERYPAQADQLDPGFRGWLDARLPQLSADELQHAQFARTRLLRRIQGLFADVDVLLTPALSAPPLAADGTDGDFDWIHYLHPFNLSGHPALSLPAGLSREGWPLGVQLVGPWYAEDRLLRVAAHLQQRLPWGTPDLGRWLP